MAASFACSTVPVSMFSYKQGAIFTVCTGEMPAARSLSVHMSCFPSCWISIFTNVWNDIVLSTIRSTAPSNNLNAIHKITVKHQIFVYQRNEYTFIILTNVLDTFQSMRLSYKWSIYCDNNLNEYWYWLPLFILSYIYLSMPRRIKMTRE